LSVASGSGIGLLFAITGVEPTPLISIVFPPSVKCLNNPDGLMFGASQFYAMLQRPENALQLLVRSIVDGTELRAVRGYNLGSSGNLTTFVFHLHVVMSIVPCTTLLVQSNDSSQRVIHNGGSNRYFTFSFPVTMRDGYTHGVLGAIAVNIMAVVSMSLVLPIPVKRFADKNCMSRGAGYMQFGTGYLVPS